MKTFFTTLAMVLVLMVSGTVFSQTKTWTGATSTVWNTATNWSPSGVPTAASNVTIPSAPANQPLINGTTTPVCNMLTVNSGATLTISPTTYNNAQLVVTATSTFYGTLSIGGVIGKTGKLITGNIVWNSTSSISPFYGSRIEVSGNWTFASGSSIVMGLCSVSFTGMGNSVIYSNSSNSKFGSINLGKSAVASMNIGSTSTALTITGSLTVESDNTFNCAYNIPIVVGGNINCDGLLNFTNGTLKLEKTSGIQSLQLSSLGNVVASLTINCGGTVTIENSLTILGNLTIQSGTLDPWNNTLKVSGNWDNQLDPDHFTEGTGKVLFQVIINKNEKGLYDQIISHSENFNILEINNIYGDVVINDASTVVTCNQYDWTGGGIKVEAGTFTALDLADSGIFGNYNLHAGGNINLTNDDGFVDLNGANITITGGYFKIYGGTSDSYWPYGNNASLTMSGGELDFVETGIRITVTTATFTANITGGTIKTSGNFSNYRPDFVPTGGNINLYGPSDTEVYGSTGTSLYNLQIEKDLVKDGEIPTRSIQKINRETGELITDEGSKGQSVNLMSALTINHFLILDGTFNTNNYTMDIKGNCNFDGGTFNPGTTGRVIFNGGNYHQYFYGDANLNILEVNKPSGGAVRISGTTVSCNSYDWTAGSIDVLNEGTFTALDLADDGIRGGYYINTGCTINLYQDNAQYVDLGGNITFTGGGTFNVYGGSGSVNQWPTYANASLTMNGGVLDFKDQSITINNLSGFALTSNITGGTIRTPGTFFNSRSDFNPTGGTIEMYGASNSTCQTAEGSLYNLTINKGITNTATLASDIIIRGNLTVNSGTFSSTAKTILLANELNINSGGVMYMATGAELRLASGKYLNVNNGGLLKCEGTGANAVNITHSAGYYFLSVKNGGTLSAKYTCFQYLNYVQMMSGSTLDPANAFYHCTFTNNSAAPLGAVLNFANDQAVTIYEANFPILNSGYNVNKSNDAGRVTFRDATGAYAGAAYENDPYNRIDWSVTQPGLWTGTVSTDWWTSANWDDGNVPSAATDVTIPATASYMPTISAGVASSKSVTINGTLTIGAADLNVAQNMTINGTLAMNNAGAELIVQGDIAWNSGSTANITADAQIDAYGHWNFNAGANANLANGTVFFMGTVNKWIRSYSANCSFYNLRSQKTGGAQIGVSDYSLADLKINGYLLTFTGSKFVSDSQKDIYIKGNITSQGTFQCNYGVVWLDGVHQSITPGVNDYFNTLIFSQTGTVNIISTYTNTITLKGNLHIDSGIFNAGSSTIKVGGDWDNNVGTAAFVEGTSRVIFNGGNYHQYCYMDETFYTLEINKPLGGALRLCEGNVGSTVVCNTYDWTAGALDAMNGNFTATNLSDNGIAGNFYLKEGGSITLGEFGSNPQLKGNITMTGGTFNIIAAIESQWPGNGNASITMSGGELNVYPYGIDIVDNAPFTFTTNITGGSIRTEGHFINNRSDFSPGGASIEMFGNEDAGIKMNSGIINNFVVNKSGNKTVSLLSELTVNGALTVEQGTLKATGKILKTGGNIAVNNGGILWMDLNSQLKIASTRTLNVNDGGLFKAIGTAGNEPVITHSGSDYYYILVHNNGTIAANRASFYYASPVMVESGGIIDPANPFDYCKFRYSNAVMLNVLNAQDLIIHNVEFLTPATGINVRKTNDEGSLTFHNASGDFSGLDFEDDTYNRINWTATQSGLWTGTVSTDWHTAANWDGGIYPTDATDVVIPATAPFMPTIGAGAIIGGITINGTLTVSGGVMNIAGNANINGTLAMNAADAVFLVQGGGDINWKSGSTANITADAQIRAFNNWNFNAGANVNLSNGTVFFAGPASTWIHNYSNNCSFYNLHCEKLSGAQVGFSDLSTEDIKINGFLRTASGTKFVSDSPMDIYIKGNITSHGTFQCNDGVVWLDGVNQTITPGVNDYFNTIVFSQTGTVNISNTYTNTITLKGNLHIDSGIFNAGSSIIKIAGYWDNNVGQAAFAEGTSRVIFNGGDYHQYCYMDETFYTLEINKPLGGALRLCEGNLGSTVFCNTYDWTAGALDAMNGSFTANDLYDNGLYGGFYVNLGGAINLHQDASQSVDLIGDVHITGGEFKVYGGNDQSYWGANGNAYLQMSGGILDFVDQAIHVNNGSPYQFTSIITGGLIRTQKGFMAQSAGFNPSAGTVEIYGAQNAMVISSDGGEFYNLTIAKPGLPIYTNLLSSSIKNNLVIDEGSTTVQFGNTISCGEIAIKNGGDFRVSSATIKMKDNALFNINEGGSLYLFGYEGALSNLTGINPTDHYTFQVNSGAWMSADHTIFENMGEQGIYIMAGATLDGENTFKNCEFRNGKAGPSPLLNINNDQELVIDGAVFPANTWGGLFNVNKNVDAGSLTFTGATGDFAGSAFENDPYMRIFWGEELAQQLISIPAGWSGISSYIIPDNAAVANIFAPVQDELVIIQNFDGMYWPTATVNTLGNWDDHAAYQIKMETAQQVTFSGTIQDKLTANLDAGWNYLPVLNACDNDVAEFFMPVLSNLQIVKEVAGVGVYWPQFGVNTLGDLVPGKAYFVLVDEEVEVEFPVCATSNKTPSNSPLRGRTGQRTGLCDGTPSPTGEGCAEAKPRACTSKARQDGVMCASTPITHTIAITLQAIAGIAEGSIITQHNQFGLCCGAAIFQNQNLVITAFGDDPTTPAIDGMTEGETMNFRVFNPQTRKEFTLEVTFDAQMPQGATFVNNGMSAVKSLESTGMDDVGTFKMNISVYPNPSTGVFQVSTLSGSKASSGLSWEVSNTHGAIIAAGTDKTDDFAIDISNYPKGIYYLKISQGGLQKVKKLVVQ